MSRHSSNKDPRLEREKKNQAQGTQEKRSPKKLNVSYGICRYPPPVQRSLGKHKQVGSACPPRNAVFVINWGYKDGGKWRCGEGSHGSAGSGRQMDPAKVWLHPCQCECYKAMAGHEAVTKHLPTSFWGRLAFNSWGSLSKCEPGEIISGLGLGPHFDCVCSGCCVHVPEAMLLQHSLVYCQ